MSQLNLHRVKRSLTERVFRWTKRTRLIGRIKEQRWLKVCYWSIRNSGVAEGICQGTVCVNKMSIERQAGGGFQSGVTKHREHHLECIVITKFCRILQNTSDCTSDGWC